jgi:hypothetical protein
VLTEQPSTAEASLTEMARRSGTDVSNAGASCGAVGSVAWMASTMRNSACRYRNATEDFGLLRGPATSRVERRNGHGSVFTDRRCTDFQRRGPAQGSAKRLDTRTCQLSTGSRYWSAFGGYCLRTRSASAISAPSIRLMRSGRYWVKVDRLTVQERRAVREALRALVPGCGRRVEGAVAGALLMARIEEETRDLCAEFVRDARSEYRLTWAEIGAAFGITMQSAQWRFSRRHRRAPTRLRR